MTREEFDETVGKMAEQLTRTQTQDSQYSIHEQFNAGVLDWLETEEYLRADSVQLEDILLEGYREVHADAEKDRHRKAILNDHVKQKRTPNLDARKITYQRTWIDGPAPDVMDTVYSYLDHLGVYGTIIRQRYIEGGGLEELSEVYKLNDSTISRRCKDYLKKLRDLLLAEMDQPMRIDTQALVCREKEYPQCVCQHCSISSPENIVRMDMSVLPTRSYLGYDREFLQPSDWALQYQ